MDNVVKKLILEVRGGDQAAFEKLRDKYRLTLVDIIRFVGGYLKFQKEIQDAKN